MLLLSSCNNDDFTDDPGGQTGTNGGDIEFSIGFAPQTRAATAADFTSTWEDGDEIGIFAVKHGDPLSPTASGNHIHNVRLTYTETTPGNPSTGSWSGALYWPTNAENIAALDFYAYHPYDATATDPTAIAFNVKTDQSGTTDGKSNYNLSDLLTAKSNNSGVGWAKGSTVNLIFSHALAMVQVTVDDRVGALDINEDITVKLRGMKAGAALDLGASGGPKVELAASGNDPGDITMYRVPDADGYVYRALVPAQTLAQDASIFRIISGEVLLNGAKLTAEVNMTAGQAETFTQATPYTALPLIPAGTFQMGSPVSEPNRQNDETQHDVTLTQDFYMSRYQITNAQYAAFLNDKGIQGENESGKTVGKDGSNILVYDSRTPQWSGSYDWGVQWSSSDSKWEASQYNGTDYSDYPVIHVTWYGAKAYCEWLALTTGVNCTLPTEAQWEYACRGHYANKATEKNTLPFGIGNGRKLTYDMANFWTYYPYDLDQGGQYTDNASTGFKNGTTAVGTYLYVNSYGLYDMHGNVLEWCSDWYGSYGSGPDTDPTGPDTGSNRVLRGGYWDFNAQYCRSAFRYYVYPDYADSFVGFRIAVVP